MAVHSQHPSTLERGLWDGCHECARKAADPIALLDSEHIRDLWCRMVAAEHGQSSANLPAEYRVTGGGGRYRSVLEATAARHLYMCALFLERHTPIDPWRWPLAERPSLRALLGGRDADA